jgi:uncharacterized protein YycO
MPITRAMGKIHAPYSHKKVQGMDVYSIMNKLVPGAVLLTRTRGELTNLVIPGDFTHAAIALSKESIIEATGKGVNINDLITFMTSKDRVVMLYPKFCGEVEMKNAAALASTWVGSPYDYLFDPDNKAFFCSELIQTAYEKTVKQMLFKRRYRMGLITVIPSDFARAVDKWELVWDSDLA